MKQMHDVSEKCHDHCGEVGNVISNNCTSLFNGCLTEFCKVSRRNLHIRSAITLDPVVMQAGGVPWAAFGPRGLAAR